MDTLLTDENQIDGSKQIAIFAPNEGKSHLVFLRIKTQNFCLFLPFTVVKVTMKIMNEVSLCITVTFVSGNSGAKTEELQNTYQTFFIMKKMQIKQIQDSANTRQCLSNAGLAHSRSDLVFKQPRLHSNFIFGML